jgi:hypothetical protein
MHVHISERAALLPRLNDTDALCVSGAVIMSESQSAKQFSRQCCIDGARSFITGYSVCLSATSLIAREGGV